MVITVQCTLADFSRIFETLSFSRWRAPCSGHDGKVKNILEPKKWKRIVLRATSDMRKLKEVARGPKVVCAVKSTFTIFE